MVWNIEEPLNSPIILGGFTYYKSLQALKVVTNIEEALNFKDGSKHWSSFKNLKMVPPIMKDFKP